MSKIVIATGVLILFFVANVQGACWKDEGKVDQMFGSSEQVTVLQTLVKAESNCSTVGVSFSKKLNTGLEIDSALIYDKTAKEIWRIHVSNMAGVYKNDTKWMSWSPVTDAKLLSVDPSSGFDLQGQKSGKGVPKLPAEAKTLIKSNAPKKLSGSILR